MSPCGPWCAWARLAWSPRMRERGQTTSNGWPPWPASSSVAAAAPASVAPAIGVADEDRLRASSRGSRRPATCPAQASGRARPRRRRARRSRSPRPRAARLLRLELLQRPRAVVHARLRGPRPLLRRAPGQGRLRHRLPATTCSPSARSSSSSGGVNSELSRAPRAAPPRTSITRASVVGGGFSYCHRPVCRERLGPGAGSCPPACAGWRRRSAPRGCACRARRAPRPRP